MGPNRRRWHRARHRAVSDIVATLLLSALAIVFAAIVYVLVAGLVYGPGAVSIGTAFTAGGAVLSDSVGTGATTTCAADSTTLDSAIKTSDWVYSLDVDASSVQMGNVLFQVRDGSGAIDPNQVAFFLVAPGGLVAACAGSSVAPAAGSMSSTLQFTYPADVAATSSSALNSTYSIAIEMNGVNPQGLGYTFEAVGQGGYSGSTYPVSLP